VSSGEARALPPQQLDKLAKVAALLASDKPGEVVAAATAATRILRAHDLSWQDLVRAITAAPEPGRDAEPDPAPEADWRADVALCLAQSHLLTGWERDFLRELRRRFRCLSPKQVQVLGQIRERVRVCGGVS
jgi:hypothetical protein